MTGLVRKKSRQQGQESITTAQSRFDGGQNSDSPASTIGAAQVALLENSVGYPGYVEGRKGTINYTPVEMLPVEGEIYSYTQNTMTGRWLLHRGNQLWLSDDVTQLEWEEVFPAANRSALGFAPSSQFILTIAAASRDNVDFDSGASTGQLYYSLSAVGILKRLRLYKDAARTQLVAEGTTLAENMIVNDPVVNNADGTFTVDSVIGATGDNTDGGTLYWTLVIQSDPNVAVFTFYSDVAHTVEQSRVVVPIKYKTPVMSAPSVGYFANMTLTGWDYSTLYVNSKTDGSGVARRLELYPTPADAVAQTGILAAAEWNVADEPLQVTIEEILGSGINGSVDVIGTRTAADPLYFSVSPSNPVIGAITAEPSYPGAPTLFLEVGDLSTAVTIDDPANTVVGVVATHPTYIILSQRNNSGLRAFASQLAYTGDETGNLDTPAVIESLFEDARSRSKEWNYGFVLMTDFFNIYVNPTIRRYYPIFANDYTNTYPPAPFDGFGSNTESTPYGRRYIATFSRLELGGSPSYDGNRISRTLVFESAATKALPTGIDYWEIWTPDAPGTTPTATPRIMYFEDLDFTDLSWLNANGYYTHVSIYATQTIPNVLADGTPIGVGNNDQIFGWLEDVPISQGYYIDTVSDSVLGTRLGVAAYLLGSRGWESVLSSKTMEFTPEILYVAQVTMPTFVRYGFLAESKFYGFHAPTQTHKAPMPVLDIMRCGADYFAIMGRSQTFISSPRSVQLELSNFLITLFQKRDDSIGIREYNAIVRVDDGNFIALCGDETVRVFNGDKWGDDISYQAVNKIIRKMLPYPLLAYVSGVVLIFYRTDASFTTNNNCLRYGFGGENGYRWSRIVSVPGDDRFDKIPFYGGVSRGQDQNATVRLFAINPIDDGEGDAGNRVYLLEKFTEDGVWREGMDYQGAAIVVTGTAAAYLSDFNIQNWDLLPLYVTINRGIEADITFYRSEADREGEVNAVMQGATGLAYSTPVADFAIDEANDSNMTGTVDVGSIPEGDSSPLYCDIIYQPAGIAGGSAIPTRTKAREITGTSEKYTIEHQASWWYLRPSDEAYQEGIEFTSNVYLDGATTPVGTMSDVPVDGQVGYFSRVKAKRIQSELVTTMSGFRMIGTDGVMKSYDVAHVGVQMGLQQGYEKELQNGLTRWAQARFGMRDRVSQGLYVTAGTVTPVNGPTGRLDAISLSAAATLADTTTYTDRITVMFWAKGSGAGFSITGTNPLVVVISSPTVMSVLGESFAIGSVASEWSFFSITRTAGQLVIRQNGVVKNSIASAATLGGTAVVLAAAIAPYDLRIKAALISDGALDYYLADVLAGGVKCLPAAI